jgi:tRNA-2-methylthio-N6-dimethylallyladenosine synthase
MPEPELPIVAGAEEAGATPAPSPRGRYWIATWGCQMNVHDSEKLAGALTAEGYGPAAAPEEADVVLLNTCSIREKAAEKVFSELGRLKPLKDARPDLVLGVCGCVAQQEGSRIFGRAPYVDLVVGTRATGSLPVLVQRLREGDRSAARSCDTAVRDDSVRFPFERIRRDGEATGKAYVTVVEGCNHRCTYCVVPRTRGPEVCRDLPDVLEEVRALAGRGILEVEFLGQTVNAYRDRRGYDLADLLLAAAEVPQLERLRFTTSHPAQMTERLMDAMRAASPKVCPYLHLPVQSGSSRVLRSMRRGYDRDGYLAKIDALRDRIPEINLGTDVIVGYPSEAEEDFAETLTLLDAVAFDTLYAFAYSARPGTAALAMGDPVPVQEKLDRLARLQAHQRLIQQRRAQRWVGQEVEVLVEGPSKLEAKAWTGRTPHGRRVNFPAASAPGRRERVRVLSATAYSLRGALAPAPA